VNPGLAVLGVELVVPRGRALEELEGAVGRVEGAHEVFIAADLVLLVAENRHQVRLDALDLFGGRGLRLHPGRVAGAGLVADVLLLLRLDRRTGLTGDVADRGQHRRAARAGVGPGVVASAEHADGGSAPSIWTLSSLSFRR
jgi:hypothetical protein